MDVKCGWKNGINITAPQSHSANLNSMNICIYYARVKTVLRPEFRNKIYSTEDWFRLPFYLRFEVFTAVTMKNGVLWDVTPCGSCKNRRFRGTWRLLHQGDKNR
jgi:hypothetical protein